MLQKEIAQAIKTYAMLTKGNHVMCAVSGGADSVALLRALCAMREEWNLVISACHLNHGLRGAESERDAEFVYHLCEEELGIPHWIDSQDVNAYAALHKMGTEEAAREVRYAFFREAADALEADRIATAHTLDDNLETMLFHLTRGTGLKGLGGIPPVRGNIIRPLIGVSRAQIEAYLEALGQSYVTDSTNESTQYTRNLIRKKVIPVLETINPQAAQAAGRAAASLREDEAYLAAAAEAQFAALFETKGGKTAVDCAAFLETAPAIRRRMIQMALMRAGADQARFNERICVQAEQLARAEKPSAMANLPGGIVIRREYEKLVFCGAEGRESCQPIPLRADSVCELWKSGRILRISERKSGKDFNKTFNTFYVDCGKIDFDTFIVRTRQPGDKIQLNEKSGHKSLRRLMIDKKIPCAERGGLAVLADKNGVIAAEAIGADWERRAQGGKTLKIQILGEEK